MPHHYRHLLAQAPRYLDRAEFLTLVTTAAVARADLALIQRRINALIDDLELPPETQALIFHPWSKQLRDKQYYRVSIVACPFVPLKDDILEGPIVATLRVHVSTKDLVTDVDLAPVEHDYF